LACATRERSEFVSRRRRGVRQPLQQPDCLLQVPTEQLFARDRQLVQTHGVRYEQREVQLQTPLIEGLEVLEVLEQGRVVQGHEIQSGVLFDLAP